jgi:hypothetical protein
MAARRIVTTSEGGGRPSRQSRPERRWLFIGEYTTQTDSNSEYPFMLPLEVVGPGGSLSTVLIATPYGRDASWRESWLAATATAAYSCNLTTAALIHRLGSSRRRQRRSGLVSSATDYKLLPFVCSCNSVRFVHISTPISQ